MVTELKRSKPTKVIVGTYNRKSGTNPILVKTYFQNNYSRYNTLVHCICVLISCLTIVTQFKIK